MERRIQLAGTLAIKEKGGVEGKSKQKQHHVVSQDFVWGIIDIEQ